jgi:tRNA threonylcarbamoyladenosine biosynthesis protein TsaB
MRILAVDTTTPRGSVAVLENRRLLAEIDIESATTHSARLLGSIDFALRVLRLGIQDIDGFAVSPGPGSFTGIRIGLSTIKSFAFASGKPIAAVSSLAALAWKLRASDCRLIAPVLDAKKGEVYAALFECLEGRLKEVVPQDVYSPDHFLAALPARRVICFIGNGAALFRNRIKRRLKDRAEFSPRPPFIAEEIGQLGWDLLRRGRGTSSEKLAPLYFRKSQAEEKR